MSSNGGIIDDLPLSLGVDLERWKFMVRGLKQLHADVNPVSVEQLSTLTKIPSTTISANVKFLRRLELLTAESKGSQMTLSADGNAYTDALIQQNTTKEKEILTNLIKKGLREITDFCVLHQQTSDLTFDMIYDQIKLLSNTATVQGQTRNTHPAYRTGIYTTIEMLVLAGVLNESFLPENNKSMTAKENGETITKKRFEIPTNCQFDWLVKLFTAIKNVNPDQVSKPFITASVVKNNHEGSVLTVARFLDMIDKDGNHAQNYDKLRLYGTDEFKKNLGEIIRSKYPKIFNIADLSSVERSNLVSAVMKEHDMGEEHAQRAVTVLVNLCRLSEIQLSESLLKQKKIENSEKPKPSQPNRSATIKNTMKQQDPIDENRIQDSIKNHNNGFGIEIKINIDAKDYDSFSNTLKFIRELKQVENENVSVTSIVNSES